MISRIIESFKERKYDKLARQVSESYSFHPDYRRIYHYHIRKTGGTSINLSFLQTSGAEHGSVLYQKLGSKPPHRVFSGNKVFVGWNKRLIENGHYFFAFSHIPMHFLNLPPETFTFTCLRDPVKRVISHYNMLCHYKLENVQHPAMKTEGKWLGKNFSDFLDRIPKTHLLNQLHMFSANFICEEAVEKIRSLNYYLFTVSLEENLTSLGYMTNQELDLFHEKPAEHQASITEGDISRLREILEPEYVMLRLLNNNK